MSCSSQADADDSSEKQAIQDTDPKPLQPSTSQTGQELTKNQIKKIARRQRLLEKVKSNRKQERIKRKERRRLRIANGDVQPRAIKSMSSKCASNIRVAIDMSFDHLMTDGDIAKLLKQLQRCYAENRRAEHALQFYITGLGGRSEQRFKDAVSGYDKWDVYRKSESFLDIFKKEEIVYLTSDSSNVLKGLV
ncbi:uncharacterized protein TRIADDRAFT_60447 [Trichoplax adhaerens]|uniref:tRNA (guanine(9)-N(1))-methyltransferase n=1 Tax=Trichoplax adhaerens TaxID=10228 RepID=B3S886_TRIAD|nr:hypothetical protein TRIADDRAFT_60447 [Trichoplax adhaerens]EDV21058.1 hypothetical protein TRIADDRAFT_60447 [Trichoplax adhaerens]|eukprot:XP_002116388.1 hypothetical protein TRIADDRAFT_60447 [Trichoplax adhaerens]